MKTNLEQQDIKYLIDCLENQLSKGVDIGKARKILGLIDKLEQAD